MLKDVSGRSLCDTEVGRTGWSHEVCMHGERVFVWLRKELASDTGSPSTRRACTALGSGCRHMCPFTS